MRQVPDIMTLRWYSGEYVGDAKPMARVTVQRPNIDLVRTPENLFSTLPFGGGNVPRELPNLKSVSWGRDIDSDVATCTLEFYNLAPLPLGQVPTRGELDQAGYYTYNRGTTDYSRRWGHTVNEWANLLMPDNMLRTFEGYGFDASLSPEADPNLVQTGVWLIDEVDLSTAGTITVQARDTGRVLLDQIAFPPVNPFKAGFVTKDMPDGAYAYPVSFASVNPEPTFNKIPIAATSPSAKLAMSFRNTSNAPYVGFGTVHGHNPRDAFDGNASTFWLSTGNARPDQGYSFEWIEGSIKSQTVRAVRFRTKGAGYTAYLGLYADGKYVGSRTVPYDPNHPASAPNGSNQRYVQAMRVSGEGWHEFILPEGVKNVTRVRLTFSGLFNSQLGIYKNRAAVRIMEAYGGSGFRTEKITYEVKNYDDYTDIVKLLCAWGGFYWPRAVRHQVGSAPADTSFMVSEASVRGRIADIRVNRGLSPDQFSDEVWVARIWPPNDTWDLGDARTAIDLKALEVFGLNQGAEVIGSDGQKTFYKFAGDDRAMTIKVGRVWGDFQLSGTAGPAEIPAEVFDKKPLMDGIGYIRDILGFVFYIDETGGAVFRAPNIYSVGNTFHTMGDQAGVRTDLMVTLDEQTVVESVTASLSSRNVRERTVVGNTDGTIGEMAVGWNPNPIGLRRMGMWLDQHFESTQECLVMAEMIALRQLFTYREDSVTIPGYPAIQIDDQVRIQERVTSEGFIHYVKGISSSLSLETGEYTYDLDTHWLGTDPFAKWAFDRRKLSAETRAFFKGLYPDA